MPPRRKSNSRFSTWKKKTKFSRGGQVKKSRSSRKSFDQYLEKKVANIMKKGKGLLSQKIAVPGNVDCMPYYSEGSRTNMNYVRIPVTRKNKLYITGVCVRFTLRYEISTTLFGVLYDAKIQTNSVPIRTVEQIPVSFQFGNANTVNGQNLNSMMTVNDTRMMSQHGPFAVRRGELGYVIDATDGSLFTCRTSQHEG